MGVSATSVLASPATTATTLAQTVALARGYASTLLDQAAVPSGAMLLTHLAAPFGNNGETPRRNVLADNHREYLVSPLFVVESFVTGHLRKGYTIRGALERHGGRLSRHVGRPAVKGEHGP